MAGPTLQPHLGTGPIATRVAVHRTRVACFRRRISGGGPIGPTRTAQRSLDRARLHERRQTGGDRAAHRGWVGTPLRSVREWYTTRRRGGTSARSEDDRVARARCEWGTECLCEAAHCTGNAQRALCWHHHRASTNERLQRAAIAVLDEQSTGGASDERLLLRTASGSCCATGSCMFFVTWTSSDEVGTGVCHPLQNSKICRAPSGRKGELIGSWEA